ncbi:MAG: response regulator transcription factor [Chitinophagaceae bacterium]|nr:response regulator transcription factor [Chitinophagaceae bacterium]
MLRILIADDYISIRKRLAQILEGEFGNVYIGEAEDTGSLLKKVFSGNWSLVISDYAMPGGGGLEALKKIKEQLPGLPVLILSIYPEDQFALQVLLAGASGYLNKDTDPETLIKAIQIILSGERYLAPGVPVPPHLLLNSKEEKLFKELVRDEKIEDIAASLQLEKEEVSELRKSLLGKMKLQTNRQLMMYARRNHLM